MVHPVLTICHTFHIWDIFWSPLPFFMNGTDAGLATEHPSVSGFLASRNWMHLFLFLSKERGASSTFQNFFPRSGRLEKGFVGGSWRGASIYDVCSGRGEGGHQKADERNKISRFVTVTGGVQKIRKFCGRRMWKLPRSNSISFAPTRSHFSEMFSCVSS